MKYLKLNIKPASEDVKNNSITIIKETAEKPTREFTIDQLLPLLMTEYTEQGLQQRKFGLDDLIKVEKVKTRLMTADRDIVELPDEVFATLNSTIREHKGISAGFMDFFAALAVELDEAKGRSDSEGKTLYEESEGSNETFKELYERLGVTVKVEEADKPEVKEEVVVEPIEEEEAEEVKE